MNGKKKFVLIVLFLFVCFLSIPMVNTHVGNAESLYVEGKAECVMELNSRRILYESNGEQRLPMASTTKILTAITVLELCKDINQEIIIPKEAEGVEGSSVYLKAGDPYSVEELLYGLMLRSGNDCAVALALHCCKSIEYFSVEMNKIAQKAGAINSNFKNPHGLPCADHYTTARDLSLITCYAMQNPKFAQIVQTQYFTPKSWKNKNKLLYNYEGAIGVKTGYTKEAGRCLVSAVRKNDMTLICTLLNCPTTYERTKALFDDAFRAYSYVPILKEGDRFNVNGMQGVSKQNFYYPLLEEEKEYLEIKTRASPKGYGKKNKEILGEFQIYLAKRLLFSGNLYKL